MQWKNLLSRIIITFFISSLLAAIGSAALGMFAGIVALIATKSFHACLIGALVGSIGGFMIGAYHGYKLGTYLHKRFVEKDLDWPEPSFLSGRDDKISVKNALLRDLRQLPEPLPTRLLTPSEIEEYRQIIQEKDNRMARDKLNHYEDFIKDASNLLLARSNHLQMRFPVTIAHQKEHYYLAKTYEKEFLINQIEDKKEGAREPIKGYPLLSPYIKIKSGYPEWIPHFVSKVLDTLRKHRAKEHKKELLYDNKHTRLFYSKASESPTLITIPEEQVEQKMRL